jgi:hypothetical protein
MAALAQIDQEKTPQKDILAFVPVSIAKINAIQTQKAAHFRSFLSLLEKAGIGELEIKDVSGNSLATFKLSDASTKKMCVVVGAVPYDDISLLWMASEKESLATGDQSLSEAVSANKCFAYEVLVHKKRLSEDVENEFYRIAGKRSPIAISYVSDDIFSKFEQMVSLYRAQREENYRSFTEFNRTIVETKDCSRAIAEIAQRLLQRHLGGATDAR